MRLQLAVLMLLGSPALVGADGPAGADTVAAPCLSGLGPALLSGDFSGSLDCREDQLSVQYVGQVQEAGRTFQVYSYLYQLKPACPECAIHGGQRILFMERGRYVGQYKPDFAKVTTLRGDLVFTSASGESVTLELTQDGPPKELWFDGEVMLFFR